MNNKISITCTILISASLFIGCGRSIKKESKSNGPAGSISLHLDDENYALIDTKESEVTWKGSNLFGAHSGYISASKGELLIEDGQLAGGTVEIDMNTIADENHKSKSGLIDHLKSPDFFEVGTYPFATIVITNVAAINSGEKEITGNLTIKGITKPVTFPVKVELKDGNVIATGKLAIDRTDWGIRYQSGKFGDDLKDKVISDRIEFNIKIVTTNKRC